MRRKEGFSAGQAEDSEIFSQKIHGVVEVKHGSSLFLYRSDLSAFTLLIFGFGFFIKRPF